MHLKIPEEVSIKVKLTSKNNYKTYQNSFCYHQVSLLNENLNFIHETFLSKLSVDIY